MRTNKWLSLAAISATFLFMTNSGFAQNNHGCINFAVGGVAGFSALAQPNVTAGFQPCTPRLYIHDYSWTRSAPEIREQVLANFPGPTSIELGLNDTPEKYFAGTFKKQYLDLGVKPSRTYVNGVRASRLPMWMRFIAAAKSAGFVTVAPVVAPNGGQWKNNPFQSESWEWLRQAARAGGAITIDSPSRFFLRQPEGYRKFIQEEIQWARQNNLYVTYIFSPGTKGQNFSGDTVKVIQMLNSMNALPDEYVFENYEPNPSPDYPNNVGPIEDRETVMGTAKYISELMGSGRI